MLKTGEFYAAKVNCLLDHAPDQAHFGNTFSGPSLDLHLWALEARSAALYSQTDRQRFLRAIFAVLPAWGMHRMGERGAKMPRFDVFESSIEVSWSSVRELWSITADQPLDEPAWRHMQLIFENLRASATNSPLVANSKVLAHLLPEVAAPIDREYILKFFGLQNALSSPTIQNSWALYRELHEHALHPIVRDKRFHRLPAWEHEMSTSRMKRIDNLIVAEVRSYGVPS